MRKLSKILIIVIYVCLFSPLLSISQIVSENCFIQAQFVELGIGPCGTFGTTVDAPPGYHPRGGSSGNPLKLGFIADQGKDGWAVGNPNYCGDYYVTGRPEEGWGISMDNKHYNNNLLCAESDVPGKIIEYRNDGTFITGTWQGEIDGLTIKAKTYVPLNKLYFLTEVTLKNTTKDTIRNVYYMRNIDPDNEVTLTSNYVTRNAIINQNPNVENKAVVTAEGLVYGCFIALGTRDCRAKVAYGGFSNRRASDAWNCQGSHLCNGTNTNDIAITISYNLGNLAPGQQTSFKFVNVLNLADLDEAVDLTGPSFLIGNTEEINSGDTAYICSSGPTVFEVVNTGGFDKWTWSPSTALNTTTGPTVICDGNINTQKYIATGVNSCGSTININFTAIKGTITHVPKSGPIKGLKDFCTDNPIATFSIDPIPRAKKYKWTVPTGSSILSGDGTTSITMDLGTAIKVDSISVCGINVCGPGDTTQLNITICNCNFIYPITPGTSSFCPGDSVIVSTTDIPGATYIWYKDGVVIPDVNTYKITAKDKGVYYAKISLQGFCNNDTYKSTLSFTIPPEITLSPSGKIFKCTGLPVTINANIIPHAPGNVRIDWYKDGVLIAPDHGSSYTTTEEGVFHTVVINSYNCRSISAKDTIVRYKLPEVVNYKLTGDAVACEGRSATLTTVNNSADGTIDLYQWYKDGKLIPGETNKELSIAQSGNYSVQLTTSKGCINELRDTFVLFYPVPIANFSVPDGCVEGDYKFSDSSTVTTGSIAKWVWKKNDELFSHDQHPLVNFAGGNYTIKLVAISDKGCASDPKELPFLRYGKPVADFTVKGFCSDSTTNLTAIAQNPGFGNSAITNWQWDFGNGISSATVFNSLVFDSAGFYSIKLRFNGNNCPVIADSVIKDVYFGDPMPNIRYTGIPALPNEIFKVSGGNDGVTYQWSPPTGLTSPDARYSFGSLNKSQQYIVHIVNGYGCGRNDTLLISIINDCEVYVPTIFSPNGDSKNDKLRAYFGCLKTLNYFNIYNRWGQLMFSTKNSAEGWDGNFNGVKQDNAAYVWVAEGTYKSGEKFTKRGSFVLVR